MDLTIAGGLTKVDERRPLRILFVDDERDLVSSLSRYFRLKGFETKGAYGVAEGVAALEEERAAGRRLDVVVTDLRMPDGIDGFALCERVAADRSLPGSRILVLSGDATPEAWARAFARGAAEFLRKPVSSEKLAATVRRLLELPEPAVSS